MNDNPERPFVVRGATVMRTPATPVRESLYVAEGRLQSQPPGGSVDVVEGNGAYAVPLMVDSAVAQRATADRHAHELIPGNPATFALVRRPVAETQIRRMLVVTPSDLLAVYVSGHAEAVDGRPTRRPGVDVADPEVWIRWGGTWEDRARGLEQHLSADGRYSETRNGRANAYTGRYWVRGDRITYLDDSGFWAFGELVDGTLHHAGFLMNRRRRSSG